MLTPEALFGVPFFVTFILILLFRPKSLWFSVPALPLVIVLAGVPLYVLTGVVLNTEVLFEFGPIRVDRIRDTAYLAEVLRHLPGATRLTDETVHRIASSSKVVADLPAKLEVAIEQVKEAGRLKEIALLENLAAWIRYLIEITDAAERKRVMAWQLAEAHRKDVLVGLLAGVLTAALLHWLGTLTVK